MLAFKETYVVVIIFYILYKLTSPRRSRKRWVSFEAEKKKKKKNKPIVILWELLCFDRSNSVFFRAHEVEGIFSLFLFCVCLFVCWGVCLFVFDIFSDNRPCWFSQSNDPLLKKTLCHWGFRRSEVQAEYDITCDGILSEATGGIQLWQLGYECAVRCFCPPPYNVMVLREDANLRPTV